MARAGAKAAAPEAAEAAVAAIVAAAAAVAPREELETPQLERPREKQIL